MGLQGIALETLCLGERLQDAPRPGATPKFTTEQRCQMAVLACEAPSQAGRPISQWTGREIADELKVRGDALANLAPTRSALAQKRGVQPHRFRYWLTEVPDEQRDEKIREGCEMYAKASERAKQGERTISLDELTGVQALERKHPDLPMQRGTCAAAGVRVCPTWHTVLVLQLRCRKLPSHRILLWADTYRRRCTSPHTTPDRKSILWSRSGI